MINAGNLRNKIIIQKKSIVTDEILQQKEIWSDYHTCYAYISCLSGKEYWQSAVLNAESNTEIIIRYSAKISDLNTRDYRILCGKRIYDITFIDASTIGMIKLTAKERQSYGFTNKDR